MIPTCYETHEREFQCHLRCYETHDLVIGIIHHQVWVKYTASPSPVLQCAPAPLCSLVQAVWVPCWSLPARVYVMTSQSTNVGVTFEDMDRTWGGFYSRRERFFDSLHDDLLQSHLLLILRGMGLDRHIPQMFWVWRTNSVLCDITAQGLFVFICLFLSMGAQCALFCYVFPSKLRTVFSCTPIGYAFIH